jgi:superfamily II DNA/RNA helicase
VTISSSSSSSPSSSRSSSSSPRSTDRPSTPSSSSSSDRASSDRASSGRPPRNRAPRRPSGDSPRPTQEQQQQKQKHSTAAQAAPVGARVAAASTEPAVTAFAELGVPANLVAVLAAQGIDSAFPIQSATLPDSLAGRDVLGRGRTGSGKTIAFALPLVAGLAASGRNVRQGRPRAVVLLPTRELATQVHETIAPLAKAAGLTTTTVFGGVSQRPQVAALRSGVDILVACPGRLEDLVSQRHCSLEDIEITVLDEADHMADLGFLPGVKRLLDRTPKDGQRLLFSATLDNGVDVLVRRYLVNPITHSVDSDATTELDIEHHVLTVDEGDKGAVVQELASGLGRTVMFTRTKHHARKLARTLTLAGVPAVDLQGNLAQNARDRNLAAFRSGEVRVLVATDIAARGIHVDDVALVVHVDPPAEHKAYLHRSGRTARAGASGIVVTVMTDAQRSDVAQLTRKAGIKATNVRVRPGAEHVLTLTGPKADYVTPSKTAVAEPERRPQQRGGRNQSGAQSQGRGRSQGSGQRSGGSGGSGGSRGRSGTSGSTSAAAFSAGSGGRRGNR